MPMSLHSTPPIPCRTERNSGKSAVAEQEQSVWRELQLSASAWVSAEPAIASYLVDLVLAPESFTEALSLRLTAAFAGEEIHSANLKDLVSEALADDEEITRAAVADLLAIRAGDPAADDLLTPFVFFKGFAALSFQRIAHRFWIDGRHAMAMLFQQRLTMAMSIDFHPAAVFGKGILLDHAGGMVVGETAVVGDEVTIFHNVTLGGTGKQRGDRHPKIGRGVFIGAGANLLGNINVGEWSRIGAGSVVLSDVPAFSIAVGVPARFTRIQLDDDWLDRRIVEAATAYGCCK